MREGFAVFGMYPRETDFDLKMDFFFLFNFEIRDDDEPQDFQF